MLPTLLIGDFILVNKFSYGVRLPVIHTKILDTGAPERGDVAVFRYPKNPSPVDAADMFPRLYFILVTAQFEGVLWMDKRKYTPLVETHEP